MTVFFSILCSDQEIIKSNRKINTAACCGLLSCYGVVFLLLYLINYQFTDDQILNKKDFNIAYFASLGVLTCCFGCGILCKSKGASSRNGP